MSRQQGAVFGSPNQRVFGCAPRADKPTPGRSAATRSEPTKAAPSPVSNGGKAERSIRRRNSLAIRLPENGVRVVGQRCPIQHVLGRFRTQGGKRQVIVPLMSKDPQNRPVAQSALSVKERMGCMLARSWNRGKFGCVGGVLGSPIFARPEKCQSGRMGLTRNQVCPHGYRGFESLLLRCSPGRSVLGFFHLPFQTVYQVHISLIVNMLCEEFVKVGEGRFDPWACFDP